MDATELASLRQTGSFLRSPNGTEYKGFFRSCKGAQQFAEQQIAMGGPAMVVVRAKAPAKLIAGSPEHRAATEGRGVLIHNDDLGQVKPDEGTSPTLLD